MLRLLLPHISFAASSVAGTLLAAHIIGDWGIAGGIGAPSVLAACWVGGVRIVEYKRLCERLKQMLSPDLLQSSISKTIEYGVRRMFGTPFGLVKALNDAAVCKGRDRVFVEAMNTAGISRKDAKQFLQLMRINPMRVSSLRCYLVPYRW